MKKLNELTKLIIFAILLVIGVLAGPLCIYYYDSTSLSNTKKIITHEQKITIKLDNLRKTEKKLKAEISNYKETYFGVPSARWDPSDLTNYNILVAECGSIQQQISCLIVYKAISEDFVK